MDALRNAMLVLGCIMLPAMAVPTSWKAFLSASENFAVRYPASWNRVQNPGTPPNAEVLQIINFPNSQREPGVVIKEGGALIGVTPAPVNAAPSGVRSLEDWVLWYERYEGILDDRAIPVAKPATGGCQQLRRIMTRQDMGSNRFCIHTDYFCPTHRGLYVVTLTNWEGDPHQDALQNTAQEITLSLRTR